MKFKFLIYSTIMLCLANVIYAHAVIKPKCVQSIKEDSLPKCDTNEFLGDDKKCYHCATDDTVDIGCNMSKEQVQKICHNRYFYNDKSYLKCPDYLTPQKDHLCKYQVECSEGYYTEDDNNCCRIGTKFTHLKNGEVCCEIPCAKEDIRDNLCCPAISLSDGEIGTLCYPIPMCDK